MRILFVSNRLPIVAERGADGWKTYSSSGGLVTALVPLLKRFGGVWIGWAGNSEVQGKQLKALADTFAKREGYQVAAVPLTEEDYEKFYQGFCNQIIWPLFHDLQSLCHFVPDFWTTYQKVEETFADIVMQHTQPDDLIWVQDYQLMGLGKALIERGVKNKIAFFLHIPFPPPDIFCKLPWRMEVLKGLLQYDVVGFQTKRDLENFYDCVFRLLPQAGCVRGESDIRIGFEGKQCIVGNFPIGIDFEEFAKVADTPAVAWRVEDLRSQFGGRQVMLGVDRLDYTKGIPERLAAFSQALERYPQLHRKVTFLQVVVPSRETVPEYQTLKAQIEQTVAQVNGKFTQPGWVPIHHVFRNVERQELLAWYRLADVAMVTPLKDGMNLVAKEYCACQVDGNGVLVLSEFAGAAEQLGKWAVQVNPYDSDSIAAAIADAVARTPEQRRPAMEALRKNIRDENVYWWSAQFLKACGVDLPAAPPAHSAENAGVTD